MKKMSAGFQRLNPTPLEGNDVEAKSVTATQPMKGRDLNLIEKLKSGDKLTIAERQQLLLHLTGMRAQSRKRMGPKLKEYRDIGVAADHLDTRAKAGIKTETIRREISKRYRLPGEDDAQDGTFFKACERGRAALEHYCKLWLKEVSRGNLSDMDPQYVARQSTTAKHYLQLIREHEKRHVQKRCKHQK